MTMKEFCRSVHKLLEQVRVEYNLSLEVMAKMIGVSKKTLIQLEKQRIILKWSEAVTICTIFRESTILNDNFDMDMLDLIKEISFNENKVKGVKIIRVGNNKNRGGNNE